EGALNGSRRGSLLSIRLVSLSRFRHLGLLQPELYVHLAVHRRSLSRDVPAPPLRLATGPGERAEAHVVTALSRHIQQRDRAVIVLDHQLVGPRPPRP